MTKKQGTRKQAKATSAGSKSSKAKRKTSAKKKASKAAPKGTAKKKAAKKKKATSRTAAAKKSSASKASKTVRKTAAAKPSSKAASARGKSSPQKATRSASSGASRSKASSKASSSTRAKAATNKKSPQKRMTAESSKTSAAKAKAKKSPSKRATGKKTATAKASRKTTTAKAATKKTAAKKSTKKTSARTTKAKATKTSGADLLSKTTKATKAVVKLGAELDKQAKAKTTKKATTKKTAAKKQPPKEPEVTTEELWILYRDASYKKEEEPRKLEELRNILIERHYPLVRYIAERLLQTLPKSIELDDLISAGLFGLMDAIRGFDTSRGIKFKTYCSTRIRGSILDQLRSQDWVPRLVRLKAGRIEKALQKLIGEYGREPTHAELAKKLEMEHGDLVKEIQDSRAKTMFSLSEKWEDGDEDGSAEKVEILEDRKAIDPVLELNRRDLMLYITRSLTAKEKFIIERYYQDGHTMREIGELLSLTESRVCQIHSNVMGRLKNLLSPREESLVS